MGAYDDVNVHSSLVTMYHSGEWSVMGEAMEECVSGGGHARTLTQGIYGKISVPSSQFCCKPETALKNGCLKKNAVRRLSEDIVVINKHPNKEQKSLIKYMIHQHTHHT